MFKKGTGMTREEAIAYGKECLSWNEFSKGMKMYQFIEMAIQALSQEPCDECKYKTFTELYFHTDSEMVEHNPCETCGYAEGSPFCLQYCPYDAERTKEQEPCDDAVSRGAVLDNSWELEYPDGTSERVVSVNDIKQLPPVQPKAETVTEFADRCRECGKRYTKRQTGKWKRISMDKYSEHAHYWYECDRCGKHNLGNSDYCPNCGADMREEQTD